MLWKQVRHVLTVVVALFVLGVSSQAAVCELACDLQIHSPGCAAGMAPMPGMVQPSASKASSAMHCAHGMAPHLQTTIHSFAACPDGICSHAALPAMEKNGASPASIAVQWQVVAAVPLPWSAPAGVVAYVRRPPSLLTAANPLLVVLRV